MTNMTDLNIIEKIGFEDGSFLAIADLPAPMQADIERYNKWTVELAGIIKDLESMQEKHTTLVYARAGAYNSINQAAVQLQQPKEQTDETPAPVTVDEASGVNSEDTQ